MLSVRPILRVCSKTQLTNSIHSSPTLLSTFHEPDPKFGYGKLDPNREKSIKEKYKMYKEGIPDLKKQVKKWSEEVHDKLLLDPQLDVFPRKILSLKLK